MNPMQVEETVAISVGRWEDWCDTFTNGNRGRLVSVEIVEGEEGAETLAENVALVAIDYDAASKGNAMVLSYGAESAPFRHKIEGPVALWQGQDANGKVLTLEVEDGEGAHTIIRLV